MKAFHINSYGGSEVFKQVEISAPKPDKGQVLVEVHATSVNPFDWKVRAGYMKDMIPLTFPVTLGADFAGVVKELGEGVTEYKVGDEVYGSALDLKKGSGTHAELVVANTGSIALKPSIINLEEASALPLVGVSSIQALEDHMNLQKGQKILIHGGAGGIGSTAIQLAKHIGAHVVTTVSGNDVEFVKKLGADEVLDYKKDKFEEKVKDVDAVFDMVGGETTMKSFGVLKNGGILVSMVGIQNPDEGKDRNIRAISQYTNTDSRHLNRLNELVELGAIKVQVDKVFPFDQLKEAFDYQENNSPRGKVVIRVKK